MKFAALALLLVMGCGKAPAAPDLTPRVEIMLAAQDYPAGESVPILLTNRSSFSIWVMTNSCPPAIEVSTGGIWTPVYLTMFCPLVVRVPQEVPPGGSIVETIPTRHATGEALAPGTYRSLFRLSGPDGVFADWYSPEFRLR
jgi:hypothetical protein